MVVFSSSFSYEQMSQTKGRIDRQGQTNPVIFHNLVAQNTVDELLLEVQETKETKDKRVLQKIKEYMKNAAA